ncbi:hypothetical protein EMIHUDRAFT_255263 [Emiliania huxleyi CCMP1516]|uniref:Uncharacterized protein n=2 Tax=Emiliania huxleyi TaxID=2903 RepID=A0A0D3JD68_EMIH1|nr:hypothetical protein EMIHUDRAFT_255263 [Emiliania huxleyi CCMP1516]EOD21453.1 hypothetical protein EMIHUDRAFT_255263 [Emiliania huxleyi CCMP1516]|eukprot:XP_005773882.1 hypothetical protein EMIHUDRAFT_255263 [Emiliania huxleyi CCMP1516]
MEPGGATGGATLKDLRSEDKLKIGNLLRELARAQREGQQATRERSQIAARLQAMRSQNDLIEAAELRGKFRHSLQLLKAYQERIGHNAEPPPAAESIAEPPGAGAADEVISTLPAPPLDPAQGPARARPAEMPAGSLKKGA